MVYRIDQCVDGHSREVLSSPSELTFVPRKVPQGALPPLSRRRLLMTTQPERRSTGTRCGVGGRRRALAQESRNSGRKMPLWPLMTSGATSTIQNGLSGLPARCSSSAPLV